MNRLLLVAIGVVVLALAGFGAVIGIQLLRDDDPNLATSAPEIPTSVASSPAAGASPSVTSAASSSASGAFQYVIDGASSEAKYVVKETLRGVVGVNAVGTTSTITGSIYLTAQGLASGQTSKFEVDLRTLRTDEAMRDNYVRQNVLQTNRFPMAEFVAESITGFPANYTEGTEVPMTLRGTLTIHGVSKQVDWAVKARHAGDTLTGIADITFNMTDFDMTPPDVGIAKAENGVQLQITIVAKRAAA